MVGLRGWKGNTVIGTMTMMASDRWSLTLETSAAMPLLWNSSCNAPYLPTILPSRLPRILLPTFKRPGPYRPRHKPNKVRCGEGGGGSECTLKRQRKGSQRRAPHLRKRPPRPMHTPSKRWGVPSSRNASVLARVPHCARGPRTKRKGQRQREKEAETHRQTGAG